MNVSKSSDALLILLAASLGIAAFAKPKLAKPLGISAAVVGAVGVATVVEKAKAAFAG